MTDPTMRTSASELEVVAEQARKVQKLYPELFAYLDARDGTLGRLRSKTCHPADPECGGLYNINEQIVASLWSLGAGIAGLASSKR